MSSTLLVINKFPRYNLYLQLRQVFCKLMQSENQNRGLDGLRDDTDLDNCNIWLYFTITKILHKPNIRHKANLAKAKPMTITHDHDFYAWTQDQAQL